MILISPSGSLAYDLFWSDIWGDMVKMISGEQCTDRDQMFLHLKIFNSVHIDSGIENPTQKKS